MHLAVLRSVIREVEGERADLEETMWAWLEFGGGVMVGVRTGK